ncbi:tetratricopeptide repeat protein [Spirillospora sp. NPDC000708]
MSGGTRNEITGGIFFSAVVQGRDITVQLPPAVTPALSGLPAGSGAFTGREDELRRVLAPLAPQALPAPGNQDAAGPAVVGAAVSGMAGVGKTELAVQAARTALDDGWFPGGVLFVDLFGYDSVRRVEPEVALEGWLRALGVPGEHVPPGLQNRSRLFTSILDAYAREGRRILVVIDNAASHEQAGPLLPADGRTAAIVTSRHRLGMLNTRKVDIGVLPAEDAVTLLRRAMAMLDPRDTRIDDHPGDAATIARLCGGLPLALRIVAALLADEPSRPLAGTVADLSEAGARLEELQYADADGEIAVRAAFALSYARLAPEQARLFRSLALNPGAEFGLDAAAVLADSPTSGVRRTLRRLRAAHLIEDGSADGRYRFHDLMRDYARERLADEDAEPDRVAAHGRLTQFYQRTAASAARRLGGSEDDRFATREQALSWLDTERANLLAALSEAHESGQWLRTFALAADLSAYLEFRHLVDDSIAAQTRALDAAARLGPRQQAVAAANLGNAYRIGGQYDLAESHLRRARELLRGVDLVSEGDVLHNLGLVYFRMGRYARAESCHRADLGICTATRERRRQGQALTALGDALRMQRRYAEAARTLDTAIHLFERLDASADAMLARVNHALTCLDWRPHGSASFIIWQLCRALKTAEEIDARPVKATIFLNLSAAYTIRCGTCHRDAAIHWALEAAALFRSLRDPRQEAGALRNVGIAHRSAGETAEADRHLRQALAIFAGLGASKEVKVLNALLAKPAPQPLRHEQHSRDEDARWLTKWCDDLPHAVLRGDTARLSDVAFAIY